jgi:outer membrane protein assembly factor BamB
VGGHLLQNWGEVVHETRVYDPVHGGRVATFALDASWFGDGANVYAQVTNGPRQGVPARGRSWIGRITSYGTTSWKTDLWHITEGNPVMNRTAIFTPSNRHSPGVIALNRRTGKLLWGANIGPSVSLVGANGVLYVLHEGTGTVDLLNMSSGALLRRVLVPGYKYLGITYGPTDMMVAGGTLYVLSDTGLVAMRP